jgi:hypothetical protein
MNSGPSAQINDHFWKRVGQWLFLSSKITLDIGANLLNLLPYGVLAPIYRRLYSKGWHKTADTLKITSLPFTVMILGGVYTVLSQLSLAVAVSALLAPAIVVGGLFKRPVFEYHGEYGVFIRRNSESIVRGLIVGLTLGVGLGFLSVYYPPLLFSPMMGGIVGASVLATVNFLKRVGYAWAETRQEIADNKLIDLRIKMVDDYDYECEADFPIQLADALKDRHVFALQALKISERSATESASELLASTFSETEITADLDNAQQNYYHLQRVMQEIAADFASYQSEVKMTALRERFQKLSHTEILPMILSNPGTRQNALISLSDYHHTLNTTYSRWLSDLLVSGISISERNHFKRAVAARAQGKALERNANLTLARIREDFNLNIRLDVRQSFDTLLVQLLDPGFALKHNISGYMAHQLNSLQSNFILKIGHDVRDSAVSLKRLIDFLMDNNQGQFLFERLSDRTNFSFLSNPDLLEIFSILIGVMEHESYNPSMKLGFSIEDQIENIAKINARREQVMTILREMAFPGVDNAKVCVAFDDLISPTKLRDQLNYDHESFLIDAIQNEGMRERVARELQKYFDSVDKVEGAGTFEYFIGSLLFDESEKKALGEREAEDNLPGYMPLNDAKKAAATSVAVIVQPSSSEEAEIRATRLPSF